MNEKRADYLTRNAIMKLLTDQEIAAVSTAEAAPRVAQGEEYLDLERLAQGIQRAGATPVPTGHVLTRKTVHEKTWTAILATLAGFPPALEEVPAIAAGAHDEITQPPTSRLVR